MFDDIPSLTSVLIRFAHIMFGIVWLGHLYFFNLVNVPFQADLDKELKPKVNPKLLLRAFWWFRWGAMYTLLFGLAMFFYKYMYQGLFFNSETGHVSVRAGWIMFGMLLGTIMWFNVWFVIWPRQKKILGAMLGGPAAPPEAAPQAALASKINTYLSGPMLWGMIAGSHVNIWDMNIATLAIALVIGLGLIHGLYARSRKVPTTL